MVIGAVAWLAAAVSAVPPGRIVVVNLGSTAARRAAAVGASRTLRAELAQAGAGVALAPDAAALLEGPLPLLFDAEAPLARARAAFARFDLGAALTELELVERAALAAAPDDAPAVLAAIRLVRGTVELADGRDSTPSFRLVARLQPDLRLDPIEHAPPVIAALRSARAPAPEVELYLEVEPDLAIAIDGRPSTGGRLALGLHLVEVEAEDGGRRAELVEVTGPGRRRLERPVAPQHGPLERRVLAAARSGASWATLEALAAQVGADRVLAVEPLHDGRVVVRLYDLAARVSSEPVPPLGALAALGIAVPIAAAGPPEPSDPAFSPWWIVVPAVAIGVGVAVAIAATRPEPSLTCCGP